jgi:hypothetical protein
MFIEYLVDLGYYTRTEIAEKTNLKVQTISSHQFGFDIARKIGDWFMENEPYLVDEFDSYYGWNQVAIKRKRNVAKRI